MFYDNVSNIIKGLKATKDQRNDFGRYNYRTAEGILEAVKPLLPDGYIINITDELVQIGERYYVKATASISCGDTYIDSCAYAREPLDKKGMDESQITGAASSYARKYALNGLLAIDDSKNDPDVTVDADAMSANISKAIRRAKTIEDLNNLNNDNQVRNNMQSIKGVQESLYDALVKQFNDRAKELKA